MVVGIFADTHDHLTQIDRALEAFEQRGVEAVLHAGDIIAPFAAKAIARVNVPLHVIYGNNDGERSGLKQVLPQISDGPVEIELGNRLIAMAHDFPQIPGDLRNRADVLVAGHTHQPLIETRQGKLWINPGECCGWTKKRSTIAILDTAARKAEIIVLPLT